MQAVEMDADAPLPAVPSETVVAPDANGDSSEVGAGKKWNFGISAITNAVTSISAEIDSKMDEMVGNVPADKAGAAGASGSGKSASSSSSTAAGAPSSAASSSSARRRAAAAAADDDSEEDYDAMKAEFAKRLGAYQVKLSNMTKERDELRQQLLHNDDTRKLQAKEEECTALRREGEKLSKRILALENSMKKYKAENSDLQNRERNALVRAENSEQLVEKKQARIKELERAVEMGRELKGVSEHAAREVSTLQSEKADLKAQLESAWRTQEQLQAALRAQQSESESASLSAFKEQAAKAEAELRAELEQARESVKRLTKSERDLSASLELERERAAIQQEDLNREVQRLNQQLQSAEKRSDMLLQGIPDATRPLLRQLESMQSSHASKQAVFEALQRRLEGQIAQLEEANEQLRTDMDAMTEDARRWQAADAERERVDGELREQLAAAQARQQRDAKAASELEKSVSNYLEEIRELRSNVREEKKLREKSERAATSATQELTSAKELIATLQAAVAEHENAASAAVVAAATSATTSTTNTEASSAELLQRRAVSPAAAAEAGEQAATASAALTAIKESTVDLEALRRECEERPQVACPKVLSLLEMKIGQIESIATSTAHLERSIMLLEDELTMREARIGQLEASLAALREEKEGFADIQRRYFMALDLLGEKEEERLEREEDIREMKEIFKQQLVEMLERCETLEAINRGLKEQLE